MSIISFVSGVLDGSGEGPAHPASAVSLSESELLIMLEIISKEASGAVDEVCLCVWEREREREREREGEREIDREKKRERKREIERKKQRKKEEERERERERELGREKERGRERERERERARIVVISTLSSQVLFYFLIKIFD